MPMLEGRLSASYRLVDLGVGRLAGWLTGPERATQRDGRVGSLWQVSMV